MKGRLLGAGLAVAVAATVGFAVASGSSSAPVAGAQSSQMARSPRAVWVGTESEANGWPVYQLSRSTDGGEHWARVFGIPQTGRDCSHGWKLAVRGRTAYAGGLYCPGGVYRTTDGGTSWTRKSIGLPRGAGVGAIAIDPRNARVVYASLAQQCRGCPLGFFRSRDAGEHWQRVDRFFYHLPRGWNRGLELQFSSILINPHEPNVIYGEHNPCVKSTDGGRSWTILQVDAPDKFLPCDSLAMDPRHPEVLYAGSVDDKRAQRRGLYKTTDGGRTWVTMQNGLPSGFFVKLAVDARNPALVYAALTRFAGEGRVYRSTNGGRTWVGTSLRLRGARLPTGSLWGELVVDPAAGGSAYAAWSPGGGAPESGVLKTLDGGRSWRPKNEGLPPNESPYSRAWGRNVWFRSNAWSFSVSFFREDFDRGPLTLEGVGVTPCRNVGVLPAAKLPAAIDVAANGTFSYAGGFEGWPEGTLSLSGRIVGRDIRGTIRVTGPTPQFYLQCSQGPAELDSGNVSFVARCTGHCDPPPLARIDALAVG